MNKKWGVKYEHVFNRVIFEHLNAFIVLLVLKFAIVV